MKKDFYKKLITEAKKLDINRFVVAGIIKIDSKFLLLERPKNDFMGGIYELPSGKVEEREDLDIALYREIEEETGLKIKEIKKYLSYFDYESKSGKKTRQFNFLVIIEEPFEIKLQDHKSYVLINKGQLDKYNITDNVKKVLRDL